MFTQVFPVLAEGFIANMRQRGETAIGEEDLAIVFQGTLTLVYRLPSFCSMLSKARDSVTRPYSREYCTASLQRLKEEIREKVGAISESNIDFTLATQGAASPASRRRVFGRS